MQAKQNILLKDYSTIKIGGQPKSFFSIENKQEISQILADNNYSTDEYFVLGDGSNTLFNSDQVHRVILYCNIKGMEVINETDEDIEIKVGAGENWDDFVDYCCRNGYRGVSCLSGIPGQIGAAPIQNIGAYGQEASQTIVSLEYVDLTTGQEFNRSNEECEFSYRDSYFKQKKSGFLITAVNFKLQKTGQTTIIYHELLRYLKSNKRFKEKITLNEKLSAIREGVLEIRNSKGMIINPQNINSRSLGSFFLNPIISQEEFIELSSKFDEGTKVPQYTLGSQVKISAAWIMEQSGFTKGFKFKKAALSSQHCLALINPKDATSSDIKEFSKHIIDHVYKKFQVRLQPEPNFVD